MINLLPPKEKKRVFDEKKKRVVLILLFFIVLFLVVFSGFMYGVKRYGSMILNQQLESFDSHREDLADIEKKNESIEEFNRMLNHIESINERQVEAKDLFTEIKEEIPAGVEIESLDFEWTADNSYQVILSGNAVSWNDLTVLEERLTKFSEVNFSSDSWRQVEDIDFLVKFIIDEEEE